MSMIVENPDLDLDLCDICDLSVKVVECGRVY